MTEKENLEKLHKDLKETIKEYLIFTGHDERIKLTNGIMNKNTEINDYGCMNYDIRLIGTIRIPENVEDLKSGNLPVQPDKNQPNLRCFRGTR